MNIKLNDGKYYVSDTLSSDGYIALSIFKNPMMVSETRIINHGKKLGRPPADHMPITEEIAMRLLRQQNIRKREQFLGF